MTADLSRECAPTPAKAIALSWLSKAGIDLPTHRLPWVSYEADEKTALVYSMDAMPGPIRFLEEVILQNPQQDLLA